MDDIVKIFLASGLTVVSGVTVFVAGQFLDRTLIIPIHDLKKIIVDIRFALVFYNREICTPVEKETLSHDEARDALRRLSCDILTKMEVIPFYSCVSRMSYGFVPLKKDVLEASKQLMGLSNSINKKHLVESNAGRISYMERLLNLKPVEN